MSLLYPLRFQPILRRYLWGGRRLESLGKVLGPGTDYAESWEIVDRANDQSTVINGLLAGYTLGELVRQYPAELLGRHAPQPRFPLLFKFLDAHALLSIQVHPDDARAAKLDPPDVGKTEAWVILEASPDSYLFAGMRPGIDADTMRLEIARRTCELCVEQIVPSTGDCFFLPAGVVHALGPGLLVAEIQQSSDTTYRLYDWGRRGPDGKTRPLHVDAALEAIDFDYGPVAAQIPQPAERPGVERLVRCDKFVLDRATFSDQHWLGGDERCHILAVLSGSIMIEGDPTGQSLMRGGVSLLPAEIGSVTLQALEPSVVLDAYLP